MLRGTFSNDLYTNARGDPYGLTAAEAIVAHTHAFTAELAEACGRHPRVIRNGLDLAPGSTAKQPHILAAGRLWDDAKNIAALASIAPDLPWPILVAGDGAAPGLHHQGRLSRPDLHRRMSEAAIFAAPARYEPFGLSILEAAAAGCALVLGDIPTLRELWTGAAMFVPPDRPEALRSMLLQLIGDEVRRERLQAAARERALTYNRERVVQG